MGYEHSKPRNSMIAGVTIGTVALLFVLQFVFGSMFHRVRAGALQEKVLGTEPVAYQKLTSEAEKALSEGRPLSIERAYESLMAPSRPALIAVAGEPAFDPSAVEGWNKLAQPKSAREAKIDFAEYQLKAANSNLERAQTTGDAEQIAQARALATQRTEELAALMRDEEVSTNAASKAPTSEQAKHVAEQHDEAEPKSEGANKPEDSPQSAVKSVAVKPSAGERPRNDGSAQRKRNEATSVAAKAPEEFIESVEKNAVLRPPAKKPQAEQPEAKGER